MTEEHRRSDSLSSLVQSIHDLLTPLEEATSITPLIHDKLDQLHGNLTSLESLLAGFTQLKADVLLEQLNFILSYRDQFRQVTADVDRIETLIFHLLDLVEVSSFPSKSSQVDYNSIIDTIEECNKTGIAIKKKLEFIKEVLDTALEFNEILETHMKTLNGIIRECINHLFGIYELKNASPVRHNSRFSLQKLFDILALTQQPEVSHSPAPVDKPRFPVFIPQEEALFDKLNQLREKTVPLEKSIVEVLPERIERFYNSRDFIYMNDLMGILNKEYNMIMLNFEFLNKEIQFLKRELVDERWNFIFNALNSELEKEFVHVMRIYERLEGKEFSSDTEDRFRQQLADETKIISRTFKAAYKGLEFSLLDICIASRTNDLAQKWSEIRELVSPYIKQRQTPTNKNPTESSSRAIAPDTTADASTLDFSIFAKPPKIPAGSTNMQTHNVGEEEFDESDVGSRTIDSIAQNLRQFSLASSLEDTKSHDHGARMIDDLLNSTNNYDTDHDRDIMVPTKVPIKPIVIQNTSPKGISSQSSLTDIAQKIREESIRGSPNIELDIINKDDDNPFFDSASTKPKRNSRLISTKKVLLNRVSREFFLVGKGKFSNEKNNSESRYPTNNNSDFDSFSSDPESQEGRGIDTSTDEEVDIDFNIKHNVVVDAKNEADSLAAIDRTLRQLTGDTSSSTLHHSLKHTEPEVALKKDTRNTLVKVRQKDSAVLKQLEEGKIKFYLSQETHLPLLRSRAQSHSEKSKPPRPTFSVFAGSMSLSSLPSNGKLRRPTPMSQLIRAC